MIRCDWCKQEFEKAEATVLDIDMPYTTEAHFHVVNHLCPDCTARVGRALTVVELAIKRGEDDSRSTP